MAEISGLPNNLATQIQKSYEEKRNSYKGSRLGGSQIGRACSRAVYYGFRWFGDAEFDGRMLRLFETGDLEEPRMVQNLKDIGVEVFDLDPSTGKQWSVIDSTGHFGGYTDGVGLGIPQAPEVWHLLEFKTHSEKSFFDLVGIPHTGPGKKQYRSMLQNGTSFNCLVQKSKPQHYDQIQVYMGLMGLDRAIYMAKNKNDDAIAVARIKFDQKRFDVLVEKANRIIFGGFIPEKINESPSWFECTFCDFKEVCHFDKTPPVNCRTCVYSKPQRKNGKWRCDLHNLNITYGDQMKGCADHEQIK